MRQLQDQRQFVCICRKILVRRKQQKTCVVFAAVFQMLAQNYPAILFCGAPAGNGRAAEITLSENSLDAPGGVFSGNSFDLRIGSEKTPALIERHRMRFDRDDFLERCARTTDQTVTNWNDDFTNYIELAVQEQIERRVDKAGQAVFDGRQKVVRAPIVNRRVK